MEDNFDINSVENNQAENTEATENTPKEAQISEEKTAETPTSTPIEEQKANENDTAENTVNAEADQNNEQETEEKATEQEEKATEQEEKAAEQEVCMDEEEDEESDLADIAEETEIADDAYDTLTLEEVIDTLEDVVKEKDVNKIKKHVSLLKIRFLKIIKEEKEKRIAANIATEEEDYDNQDAVKDENTIKDLEERFTKAFNQYKDNKQAFIDSQEQRKQANLEEKKQLLEQLKLLIDSNESLKNIYDKFKEIQEHWKSIGPVPQAETNDLWQNYHFYVEKFFDKVKINKELRDLDLKKNLELKIALCEKAEALLLEPSIYKAFNTLQQYHNEWKEIGATAEDKTEEIWLRFKDASDRINQKRKEHYENLLKDQENNYQAKLALCNKAQEITNIDFSSFKQINEASKATNELFNTWKTIGPAPKQHNDDIWNRFKDILDSFYESKKQFFEKMKSEQLDNYNKKVNLCIQAEAIATRNDWRKATADILKLQQEWKEVGPVSKKQSDILWKRFRKACDVFFDAKEDYFKNIDQHEKDNLAKKEALIQKVKETPFAESKEENLKIIKEFQREWTGIGYTPIKDKERLWKEFRAAIDKRFEELNMKEEDIRKINYQERIKNILEDSNSSQALQKEKRFLQNKIAQLKEEVALWENNLGFFAESKNSDLLKVEFEKKINKAKETIQQYESKLQLLKEVK